MHNYEFWKLRIMTKLIPFCISLFKFILTELMKALTHFRRYPYQINRIMSQTFIIFSFYFFATGLLLLMIDLVTDDWNLSFFQVFNPMIKLILHEDFDHKKIVLFHDYSKKWYQSATDNIMMVGVVSFNLSAVGLIIYCYVRRKIC